MCAAAFGRNLCARQCSTLGRNIASYVASAMFSGNTDPYPRFSNCPTPRLVPQLPLVQRPSNHSRYCPKQNAFPAEYSCFVPDVMKAYDKLLHRYNGYVTKREPLWKLAQPRVPSQKFQSNCICPRVASRKTTIVRLDAPMNTRTEQLSYPTPRLIECLRDMPTYKFFESERKSSINRLYRKSLLSVYSHLMNARGPKEPRKVQKRDAAQMKAFQNRINALSAGTSPLKKKPVPKAPPTRPVVSVPAKKKRPRSMKRLENLSKPRLYVDNSAPKWQLTEPLRTYSPTPRILRLARHRPNTYHGRTEPFKVKPGALHYKPTDRVVELAMPIKINRQTFETVDENPFLTKPNALKAEPSKRIIEMAAPRQHNDAHTRGNPFKVSRAALHAKISKRLIELSRPRVTPEPIPVRNARS